MPELDIRYLINANPSSYRSTLGPIRELTASIKEHGVQRPLLVMGDFQIVDGHRRLAAAKTVKLQTVPIQRCEMWTDILAYFTPTDEDCYPMDWVDLVDFQTYVLKPIHEPHRHASAVATRRAKTKYKGVYSGFVTDLATIYNVLPQTMRSMRDYIIRMRGERARQEHPLFVKGALELLPTGEAARHLAAARVIKAVYDSMHSGVCSEEQSLERLEARLAAASSSNRPRVPRTAGTKIDRTAPFTETRVIENWATVLDQLGVQASNFMNFDMTSTNATSISETIGGAMAEFTSLRKRLKTLTYQQGADTHS